MKTKLVVLEGLDGSGKSTQIELLQNLFKQRKIGYKYIHFPVVQSFPYGDLISRYLRGEFGGIENVHPQLVALLFALNRSEFKDTLESSFNVNDDILLLDRYVYSNIAFQCSKLHSENEKKALKEWIINFEFCHLSLPVPDLSLYLDVPYDFMKKNLLSTREGYDRLYLNGKQDIHEGSMDLQKKVAEEYNKLTEEDESFIKITCYEGNSILSKEEIHLQIIKILGQRVGL